MLLVGWANFMFALGVILVLMLPLMVLSFLILHILLKLQLSPITQPSVIQHSLLSNVPCRSAPFYQQSTQHVVQ
jgi:hypothetical protein